MSTDRPPPLHWLEACEAAARHGRFLEAAAERNVAPGSVSGHVKRLESCPGTEPFVRRGNAVTLASPARECAGQLGGIFRNPGTVTVHRSLIHP